jgi:hypothetical protein
MHSVTFETAPLDPLKITTGLHGLSIFTEAVTGLQGFHGLSINTTAYQDIKILRGFHGLSIDTQPGKFTSFVRGFHGTSIFTEDTSVTHSVCMAGPSFAITGSSAFTGNDVRFQITVDSTGYTGNVLSFEWYLDGNLVINQRQAVYTGQVSCGYHVMGARLLSTDGWSGVKAYRFQACAV